MFTDVCVSMLLDLRQYEWALGLGSLNWLFKTDCARISTTMVCESVHRIVYMNVLDCLMSPMTKNEIEVQSIILKTVCKRVFN